MMKYTKVIDDCHHSTMLFTPLSTHLAILFPFKAQILFINQLIQYYLFEINKPFVSKDADLKRFIRISQTYLQKQKDNQTSKGKPTVLNSLILKSKVICSVCKILNHFLIVHL